MDTFAQTPTPEPRRQVNVSGEGLLRVQPDMAIVRFGVVTEDADPEQARRRNAEAAAQAMNVVRGLGIDERKMRLETLMLQPRREYNPDTKKWDDLGYVAMRDVVVEVENLDRLPALIAGVVQKGANRLNGIQYDLRDKSTSRNEALRQALLQARDKAQLMATTLGAAVGQVMQINEQAFDFPRPMFRAEMAASMAKADVAEAPEAYAAGEMEVRAVVQVVFELR